MKGKKNAKALARIMERLIKERARREAVHMFKRTDKVNAQLAVIGRAMRSLATDLRDGHALPKEYQKELNALITFLERTKGRLESALDEVAPYFHLKI